MLHFNDVHILVRCILIEFFDFLFILLFLDVAKYLRLFSATLQSINAAQLDMISLMTSGVIEPLKNYADFDFLEMQNTKKKVIATAGEFESLCAKIESAQGGKKFGISRKDKAPDPVQIAQVYSSFITL